MGHFSRNMDNFEQNFKVMSANRVFLSLGSNLGDKLNYLNLAKTAIKKKLGKIRNESAVYESGALGFNSKHQFYNMVLEVESKLTAHEVLDALIAIEFSLGRSIKSINSNYQDRLIDIDILYFNQDIIESLNLYVPHKELYRRKFVLVPLSEIASDFIDPVYQQKISDLLFLCQDESEIQAI